MSSDHLPQTQAIQAKLINIVYLKSNLALLYNKGHNFWKIKHQPTLLWAVRKVVLSSIYTDASTGKQPTPELYFGPDQRLPDC